MTVTIMSREDKEREADARAVARAMRRGLLHGFMDGFSGPLLMGTPALGVKIVTAGRSAATSCASFANSSKEVGITIKQAAEDLMRNKSLVNRKVTVRKIGADGKYHTVMTTTVGRSAADDEPRE
jgi:hypothetical protein